ncbi:phenylacetate--CoA ligase family protein [Desertifilum sp. FACHB-1129]|uniref:Phenylacetate--CoA ligase n=1 Tax=Desertifilum tharense IPPAS B-1220 TaxID=1781255 RepID=A0A1E5QJA1_9CYAN|nr:MULTISPECIES: phenylacetate--CoA ligase family protein [Desertifilum]MDA0211567.1 phenylacetate--CoA ligase family protein [Cyanobacteria bacterium FC1]MBD2310091.1 phenylacetate--CoA ligase family protein [Desertifilum sp. FACHB-1129]MBD2322105.1 phenylacetate--CoA ligase family protein [Desertifilum sp. FACHB-866]MBD2333816.1 phenylacetate--CoA ligase family protein [Desertifilum sp. FACHB-868]OEJ74776.1 phenylacetate--CoA ligase [Desertifilum tharense IPPAS B-1220]
MQPNSTARYTKALTEFLSTPLETVLARCLHHSPEQAVVELFHSAIATVPAYQAFIQEREIDPTVIQNFTDFQTLPLTTKQNYHRQYPLTDLCRHGQLEWCDTIAVSSGSTGQPTFWPRFASDELHITTRFEQIFRESFQADTRRTLAVVCFTLGTWVGGMFTTNCCRYLALKGYPITVVTPGNNLSEIFRVVQALGDSFEQVVLLGYPPFLKTVVDNGMAQGIEWGRYQIKMVFAGEVFSEEWRDLVAQRIGATSPYYDFAAMYGTADAGVLGNETPLSICIRRFLAAHPQAAKALFGESRLPTLVQYDPLSRFFEVQEGTLLFSGDNGIPLLRYHINDTGGIIPYEQMLAFLNDYGFDPVAELHSQRGIHPLPFVYVFGRSDFTVSFFGANIYPENVTVGLEQPTIREWVTGKFVLQVQADENQDRYLSVVVELAPGVTATEEREKAIALSIQSQLLRLNSEFANYVPPEYQQPQITLTPTGDPEYFPVGVKHRYTRK